MSRLEEVLSGKQESYILPFFWQHGEEEAVLRSYVKAIYDSNIREMCLECRPHPDFLGEQWWHDMDVIMQEARDLGMGVWLLDDAHFPTGVANGAFEYAPASVCKEYINMIPVDVQGPMPQVTMDVAEQIRKFSGRKQQDPMAAFGMESEKPARKFDTDRLLKVAAYRIEENAAIGKCLDITEQVENGILTFDVPAGMWRIYIIYYTQNGCGRTDYMNIINADSVQVLIDTVYEPVWNRYREDFGGTFRGFFSDEPISGNYINNYDDRTLIGERQQPLPWCRELEEILSERLGPDMLTEFPVLWDKSTSTERTAQIRFTYMDAFTTLVEKNFSDKLGTWCKEHGVRYIGHLVEDNNRSATVNYLGCWARGMHGQAMAGIDCIGGGVFYSGENRLPGGSNQENGEFYHFTLAKLAASLAMLDEKKEGRSLVECFGAYGWNLGLRGMKYIVDHFMVRGINHFVPHAFSPKAFPDPDCPPHFYAGGENPLFHGFGRLMQYVQRACHLISDGRICAPAAILHSDMAAWCGPLSYPEKIARRLAENQIDYLFIFEDYLSDAAFENGKMRIGRAEFEVLIIPPYSALTSASARLISRAEKAGFPVFYVDRVPELVADAAFGEDPADQATDAVFGEDPADQAAKPEGVLDLNAGMVNTEKAQCVDPDQLIHILETMKIAEAGVTPAFKGLRILHYSAEEERFLLVNENMGEVFRGSIEVKVKGTPVGYDAMNNALEELSFEKTENGVQVQVEVRPYESLFVIFQNGEQTADKLLQGDAAKIIKTSVSRSVWNELKTHGKIIDLRGWEVSISENPEREEFKPLAKMDIPENIAKYEPDFSGFIRYETEFGLSEPADAKRHCVLRIEDAWEAVRVWCNGEYAGEQITPDYLFDMTGMLSEGNNRIRVEVATTLERRVRKMEKDVFHFIEPTPALAPTGMIGKVQLLAH